MNIRPCDLLGRDLAFNRMASPGVIRSRVTVTAFDPEKGWKLVSRLYGATWVPAAMLHRLFADNVLEVA